MAFPTSFDESNEFLDAPPGMHDCVGPLSVLRMKYPDGMPVVVSCFKVTAEELAEINKTGRIWLGVLGVTMPPAFLAGIKPFQILPIDDES